MAKKKAAKKSPSPKMVKMPNLPIDFWMGQFIVSSMMVNSYLKHRKVPKYLGVSEECMKEMPDGSGKIEFFATF